MHRHAETCVLAYTPEQMFDLVSDIEKYRDFLPWVTGARVIERKEGALTADLMIGYGPLQEQFTSQVMLERPKRIDVVGVKGPFRHLENHWTFEPATKDGKAACAVGFAIEFAFKSFLLQAMMGALFSRSVDHMVEAFERRAAEVYAKSAQKRTQDTAGARRAQTR